MSTGTDIKWSSQGRSKYHGLRIQGATCYLNSVLQVLYMTKDFREAVKSHCHDNPKTSHIDLQLNKLFDGLKTQVQQTCDITQRLGIQHVYQQQDAADYYEKILRMTSPKASQIFHGKLTHRTTCSRCETKTDADGPFWSLHLAMPDPKTVYDMKDGFERLFQPASISGDNQMYCDKCDNKEDATIICEMKEHPEVLMLLLKRFDFDYQEMKHVKINSCVIIPDTLHIPQKQAYELYAIVDHVGTLNGGHYTASIKSLDGDDHGRWYSFDDSRVTKVDPDLQSSKSAYLLFYRKKHMHSPDTSPQETTRPADQSSEVNISDSVEIANDPKKRKWQKEDVEERVGDAKQSKITHSVEHKGTLEDEDESKQTNQWEPQSGYDEKHVTDQSSEEQQRLISDSSEMANDEKKKYRQEADVEERVGDAKQSKTTHNVEHRGITETPKETQRPEERYLVKTGPVKSQQHMGGLQSHWSKSGKAMQDIPEIAHRLPTADGDVRKATDKVGGVDGVDIVKLDTERSLVYNPEQGEQRKTQGDTQRYSGESMGGEKSGPVIASQVSVAKTGEESRAETGPDSSEEMPINKIDGEHESKQTDQCEPQLGYNEKYATENCGKTDAERSVREIQLPAQQFDKQKESNHSQSTVDEAMKTDPAEEQARYGIKNQEVQTGQPELVASSGCNRGENKSEVDQDTGRSSGQEEASVENSRAESIDLCNVAGSQSPDMGHQNTGIPPERRTDKVNQSEASAKETKSHEPQNTLEGSIQTCRNSQCVSANTESNEEVVSYRKQPNVSLVEVTKEKQGNNEITTDRYFMLNHTALPQNSSQGSSADTGKGSGTEMQVANCVENHMGRSDSTECLEEILKRMSSLSLEEGAVEGSEASIQGVCADHGGKPETLNVGGLEAIGTQPREGEQTNTQGDCHPGYSSPGDIQRTSGESTVGGGQSGPVMPSQVSVAKTGEESRADTGPDSSEEMPIDKIDGEHESKQTDQCEPQPGYNEKYATENCGKTDAERSVREIQLPAQQFDKQKESNHSQSTVDEAMKTDPTEAQTLYGIKNQEAQTGQPEQVASSGCNRGENKSEVDQAPGRCSGEEDASVVAEPLSCTTGGQTPC